MKLSFQENRATPQDMHAYIEIHRVREMKGTQQQPEDSAPRFQPGWNVLIGSSKAGSLAGTETNDKVQWGAS